MAGKQLRTHVHVIQADGTTNVYGPDDTDIPAEDLAKIGDHCFVADGEEPVVESPTGTVVHDDGPAVKSKPRKSQS